MGIATGPSMLSELGEALDALHDATAVPIMGRRSWLDSWINCYPEYEPWAIYVEGSRGLEAAALLANVRRHGILHVVRLGHGTTDYARLPSRNPESALLLAQAMVAEFEAVRGPWHLYLGQLPVGDTITRAILTRLPRSSLAPGEPSPTVRFVRGRSVDAYISRKLRSNLRTRMNRLRREGWSAEFRRLREVDEVAQVMPETERVRRARDAALGRKCRLDDPPYLMFRRTVLLELASRGEAEIATFRIDGELAAYQIGLLDGSAYRQWDTRFDPVWGQFAPGTQLNRETLSSVLGDSRFEEYDFMRGMHPEKMEFATEVIPAEVLSAWSSSLVRRSDAAKEGMKRAVKSAKQWIRASR